MSEDRNPLLIVADSYRLACHYAQNHDLGSDRGPQARWCYVGEIHRALGRRGPGHFVYVTIGECSPREREERLQVIEHLRMAGFTRL